MTGKELIQWIRDNKAEDMLMLVQYRDSGGIYPGACDVEPCLCNAKRTGVPYDTDYDVRYHLLNEDETRNAVAF